ncbi:MAG TPA: hypothetical protein DD457_00025 [Gammaproteobacteria bacterium]|nr:hypothetical protein [Gammaproteobacteria bacterium]HBP13558.1 hypothetical protein [Gammaproteobacteria bacterium]
MFFGQRRLGESLRCLGLNFLFPVGSRMKNVQVSRLSMLLVGLSLTVMTVSPGATVINDIFKVAEQINAQAKISQVKIDATTEQTRELYADYKVVLKEIEGLQVYNRQLERQIAVQEREMRELAASIDRVTEVERQVMPLMLRMIEGIDQFVGLDIPFRIDERRERIERLRTIMDRADVAVSEKFSQVLGAYQIENEYGRTLEAYSDTITLNGSDIIVDLLKVGRVALVWQSKDREITGWWNRQSKRYEEIDESDYATSVSRGIKMARKQLTAGLFAVPVIAPES